MKYGVRKQESSGYQMVKPAQKPHNAQATFKQETGQPTQLFLAKIMVDNYLRRRVTAFFDYDGFDYYY